ncbi:hypothetical protein [Pedobacter sp. NJ-S-72]
MFINRVPVYAQQHTLPEQIDRWSVSQDGSIFWKTDSRLPHADHIEMSGQKVSLWVQYEVDSLRRLHLKRTVVFPTFRMKPNDTHASLMQVIGDNELPKIFIDGKPLKDDLINGHQIAGLSERVTGIRHHGIMEIYSEIGSKGTISLKRSLFPSADKPMAIEKLVFINKGNRPALISMDGQSREVLIDTSRSYKVPHKLVLKSIGDGAHLVQPGDSVLFSVSYQAAADHQSILNAVVLKEEEGRKERVRSILQQLQLVTPDIILNTAFAFAKIRAAESIFKTKGGLMHGPGGLSYYAAIWANDEAEYVNPFFAFLGDDLASKSAMNSYRMFSAYMNPEYKPIPSSIIAEGTSFWNGAGDRGDQAMIAYGASRYALANGNIDSARVLWPLIEWCLEYSRRKLNAEGVVASQSDELEGRFPAGKANLSTSSLYYDALISASKLSKLLGKSPELTKGYLSQAKELRGAIDKYFAGVIEGFDTYRYYKENTVLRSWICMYATYGTVGIYEHKEGTIKALFSPGLFTPDGLLTQAGDKTFWDRSTLYALRGILAAGETELAMPYLQYYSRRRLLGEHVPYPVEAYPEGGQRHLSAESGLYCRVFTEGLFGMRPVAFDSFTCTPGMPKDWKEMALKNIHSFGNVFDLEVSRLANKKLLIRVKKQGKVYEYRISKKGIRNWLNLIIFYDSFLLF